MSVFASFVEAQRNRAGRSRVLSQGSNRIRGSTVPFTSGSFIERMGVAGQRAKDWLTRYRIAKRKDGSFHEVSSRQFFSLCVCLIKSEVAGLAR